MSSRILVRISSSEWRYQRQTMKIHKGFSWLFQTFLCLRRFLVYLGIQDFSIIYLCLFSMNLLDTRVHEMSREGLHSRMSRMTSIDDIDKKALSEWYLHRKLFHIKSTKESGRNRTHKGQTNRQSCLNENQSKWIYSYRLIKATNSFGGLVIPFERKKLCEKKIHSREDIKLWW